MPEQEKQHALKLECGQCRAKLDVSLLDPFSIFDCPSCGQRLRVPKVFGHYLLEKECGAGGMSTVYRATDKNNGMLVAVKVLREEFISDDPDGANFLRAAHIAEKVSNPGIVAVLECGICNRTPYTTMEYMGKGSLEALLKNDMLPPSSQVFNWISAVAGGLQAALNVGIVHHDVKPGNMLLSDECAVKLSDFDLADLRVGSLSKTSLGWASPAYASPERLNTGEEDYYGDIFSLGVSLYELLSGHCPYNNKGDSQQLLDRRRNHEYFRLMEVNSETPLAVSDLVDQMLDYAPIMRPSYADIIRVLNTAAGTAGTMTTRNLTFREKLKRFLPFGD
ncbi:MAG: serine/threonine-protein kinase [Victivallaceae bacterium]|nr:serine/threonine-protein kinase [Victivallaceae bacterium]